MFRKATLQKSPVADALGQEYGRSGSKLREEPYTPIADREPLGSDGIYLPVRRRTTLLMLATSSMLLTLALLTLIVPLVVRWVMQTQPAAVERLLTTLRHGISPSQEDFLIGFPLFIVFCGILMGWMLLFVGVVRQGMLQ